MDRAGCPITGNWIFTDGSSGLMSDVTLKSYVREEEGGPKRTCFGEVRVKVGISPIFLGSATRPRNIADSESVVWAPLPTGVLGALPTPASTSPLTVLSSGPLRSPAQCQVRTDAPQGSEPLLAGLPQKSSLQRASVLQPVLSLSRAGLRVHSGSPRLLRVPPRCFPPNSRGSTVLWRSHLESGVWVSVPARWFHEVLCTSFNLS